MPSSSPTRNTCGNSRPFAACSVDSRTASGASPSFALEHRDQRDELRQLEEVAIVGLALARQPVDEVRARSSRALPRRACRASTRASPRSRSPRMSSSSRRPAGSRSARVAQAVDRARRTASSARAAAPARPCAIPGANAAANRLSCRAAASSPRCAERGLSDAAPGRGDRAQERGIVVVVGDQAQVRDDVLDLGASNSDCPPETS